MEDDPLLRDHKLCGFLRAVLTATTTTSSVVPGTPCSLFGEGSSAGFVAEDGTLLLPILEDDGSPQKGTTTTTATPPSRKRGRRRGKKIGMVDGSVSVVHQIQALVAHRCLVVRGTVVGVSRSRGVGNVRAVVLVDVYLPMSVWSGWQFPKSGGLAASLFRHVSCNWDLRRSLHDPHSDKETPCEDVEYTWNNSDCHVLGCNIHCNISDSNKNKLFDLHEVFKSLPSATKEEIIYSSKIEPENATDSSGIWNVADDVLTSILATLGPRDLASVSSTCRHLQSLASSTMPYVKLKLFPHQQAALEWMLKRERYPSVLPHPLYMKFSTEDGFDYCINSVSGKISTGSIPTINDFHGGMFCDEPGLGKTITALSLILKTHGTLADPPHGVDVMWCTHNQVQRCGYYELGYENLTNGDLVSPWKRSVGQNVRRRLKFPTRMSSQLNSRDLQVESFGKTEELSYTISNSLPGTHALQCNGRLSQVKRNLLDAFEKNSVHLKKVRKKSNARQQISDPPKEDASFLITSNAGSIDSSETWVQCDACRKWRRLSERNIPDATVAWFCSMNSDHLHQSCSIPEESWDRKRWITYLPGFYTKGTRPGKEQNTSYFISILKEHFALVNSETKKALNWLAELSYDKLSEMEANGLTLPVVVIGGVPGQEAQGYEKIFQAFGLVRKFIRGRIRWHYPCNLENLTFDSVALQIALTKPLDSFRLYLSRATLIIVPANLVEHWKTQIQKLLVPGQLRVFVWIDHRKPSAHNLAWDYDVVIMTFSRLSAEWSPRKRSVLTQVHWLRVLLDEGHTLGSSLTLTNKLQMAISLAASNRWILTGTPTPNTPNGQLTHLQPMLKFLHEEAYGLDQGSWDAGILKPYELEMEEGRFRLLQLLKRAMICARKKDLKTIPPCIKKVTFLHFNEEHARSYNELVVTVRRNILMADWNDPSHVESLLNPKQWKFRGNTIRNVRLSCCVSGHIKVTEAGHDIQDTMDIFVQQGLHPLSEEYGYIKSSLLNGGFCMRCKDWCRLPVITPCRHLLCLDCVALDGEKCTLPGCGNSYEMQYPEMLTRPENPNPKWPVPKDLIELQPSYRQDNWDPDWQSTSSSKVSYLIERLKHLQEANKKLGCCEHVMDYKDISSFDKSHMDFFTEGGCREQPGLSCMTTPDKVIIFSQFLEHIHVIEQQLTIAGIDYVGMYSPMHSSNKLKSLMIFQQDTNCMALLMDGSAALGLDLSFVTHVFLMEPIWDRSMEEQVISRAHRMGATRPIHVETLAMHGTIEEQMLEFLQDTSECRKALKKDLCRTEEEGVRVHRTLHDFAESNYLSQLGFVKTNKASR